jgi:predicted methyltransferase
MDSRIRNISAALAVAGIFAFTSVIGGEAPAPAAPPTPYVIPAKTPDYIRKAVESPGRATMAKDDFNRKPAELLTLAGIKPGDRVIEFASFGQYFTTLLSDIVGPKGEVYMYDLPYLEARTAPASKAFVAAHPNAKFEIGDFNAVQLPQNVDGVYIVLYYHDLELEKTGSCCVVNAAKFNERVFKALKPGGVYFIVDHNAEAGSGRRDSSTLHRIDPAVIKQEVKAAGFELVEDSKLLSSAKDDGKQTVFGRDIRRQTDQSVLKFRKPLK